MRVVRQQRGQAHCDMLDILSVGAKKKMHTICIIRSNGIGRGVSGAVTCGFGVFLVGADCGTSGTGGSSLGTVSKLRRALIHIPCVLDVCWACIAASGVSGNNKSRSTSAIGDRMACLPRRSGKPRSRSRWWGAGAPRGHLVSNCLSTMRRCDHRFNSCGKIRRCDTSTQGC